MSQHTQGRVSGKVRQVVQELNQSQGLAFKDVLSEQEIREVLLELGVTFRQRIFTPIVTVWVFLTQVLDFCKVGFCCMIYGKNDDGKRRQDAISDHG